jgi:hypothetical protein
MSIDNSNNGTENRKSVGSKTTEPDKSNSQNRNCTYWVRHDGREFITDPNGDVVNLARLTAYAEYGDDIHDGQAHHEMPLLKIDAPAFLDVLGKEEHGRFHFQGPEPVEKDGFPVLRAGR